MSGLQKKRIHLKHKVKTTIIVFFFRHPFIVVIIFNRRLDELLWTPAIKSLHLTIKL